MLDIGMRMIGIYWRLLEYVLEPSGTYWDTTEAPQTYINIIGNMCIDAMSIAQVL